ncbi:MAG TPA: histidine kinase dimerization/phospho-acceptor domain-containing protein, partial [Bacteroidota bacterium]|nr:histidine kinase dimerization/phospho-acceptor domain-containing protein [Bacteroidota bacterium]
MIRGMFRSIRVKLTIWYTSLLLLTLIAFGVVAYTYSSQALSDNLDRSLTNEVGWVKNYIESKSAKVKVRPSRKFNSKRRTQRDSLFAAPPPVTQESPAADSDEELWNRVYEHALLNTKRTMIEVLDVKTGMLLYSAGGESLMVDAPLNILKMTTIQNRKGDDLRVAATSTDKLKIFAAYPLSDLKELLGNLFSILLILIPVAGCISIAGGWFLAKISLKPVDEVTQTVREITAHNLNKRVPPTGVDDEIGRLISTFNEMIARLNSSFQEVKQFSIDASHELRTPLTIMRGEVELALRNPKSPDTYREVLASNLEEIARLTRIIENLSTLSKADLGQFKVEFEQIDLGKVVDELYEDAEILAMKKEIGVTLVNRVDAQVYGDKVRLRQLFLNLIDNAVKYTPEHGKVFLSLERENGFAE